MRCAGSKFVWRVPDFKARLISYVAWARDLVRLVLYTVSRGRALKGRLQSTRTW